jgi:hypothetical protein
LDLNSQTPDPVEPVSAPEPDLGGGEPAAEPRQEGDKTVLANGQTINFGSWGITSEDKPEEPAAPKAPAPPVHAAPEPIKIRFESLGVDLAGLPPEAIETVQRLDRVARETQSSRDKAQAETIRLQRHIAQLESQRQAPPPPQQPTGPHPALAGLSALDDELGLPTGTMASRLLPLVEADRKATIQQLQPFLVGQEEMAILRQERQEREYQAFYQGIESEAINAAGNGVPPEVVAQFVEQGYLAIQSFAPEEQAAALRRLPTLAAVWSHRALADNGRQQAQPAQQVSQSKPTPPRGDDGRFQSGSKVPLPMSGGSPGSSNGSSGAVGGNGRLTRAQEDANWKARMDGRPLPFPVPAPR